MHYIFIPSKPEKLRLEIFGVSFALPHYLSFILHKFCLTFIPTLRTNLVKFPLYILPPLAHPLIMACPEHHYSKEINTTYNQCSKLKTISTTASTLVTHCVSVLGSFDGCSNVIKNKYTRYGSRLHRSRSPAVSEWQTKAERGSTSVYFGTGRYYWLMDVFSSRFSLQTGSSEFFSGEIASFSIENMYRWLWKSLKFKQVVFELFDFYTNGIQCQWITDQGSPIVREKGGEIRPTME